MKRQGFQYGEIRDENDNIIQEGSYGKGTAFATSDNMGILDYTMNNFQALFDMMSSAAVYVDTKTSLPAVGDGGKLYITKDDGKSWRWDGEQYVELSTSIDGKSAYEIAIDNGFTGTEADWLASLGNDTIVNATVDTDGYLTLHMKSGGAIKTPLQPIIDCISYRDASRASQGAAKTSETNANNAATLAQQWAMSSDSPDNTADTDSKTQKTQSSKTWALYSKDRADSSASSAASATTQAKAAQTAASAAKESQTKAEEAQAATADMVGRVRWRIDGDGGLNAEILEET